MTLYHASQQKNLKLLLPQPTKSNNKYIGDYLFATKNFNLALMYLTPKGIPILMEPYNDPNIVICSDVKSFKNLDNGGAIYSIHNKYFMQTPQKNLSSYEMVSTTAVKPLKLKIFDSVLDAFIIADIKVRFVNSNQFKKLIRNPKQKELISNLPIYKP